MNGGVRRRGGKKARPRCFLVFAPSLPLLVPQCQVSTPPVRVAKQLPSRDGALSSGDRAGHQGSLHLFIFLKQDDNNDNNKERKTLE